MAIHSERSRRIISDGIAGRTVFRRASMSGRTFRNGAEVPTGRLEGDPRGEIRSIDGPVYVVFSYGTPIGWAAGDRWTVPAVTYSPTTDGHQALLRRAVPSVVDA